MKYYAVKVGKRTGIFRTWSEAEPLVKGYSGAKFKSFATKQEAEQYLQGDSVTTTTATAPRSEIEPEGLIAK